MPSPEPKHSLADPFDAFLADEGTPPTACSGPLDRYRLAVKDCFDVAGYPTGFGQPELRSRSPLKSANASVVETLLARGARYVGKTQMVEMAFALTGRNLHYGTPINPAHPDRLPGGSSSGSAAAVAGDLADIGLGSDTFGSIRVPASYCGVYGYRPSHGLFDLTGCLPLAPSMDTAGWLTRDLETLTSIFRAFFEESDPHPPPPLAGPLLVPSELLSRADPACQSAFWDWINTLSLTVEQGSLCLELDHWVDLLRIIQGFEAWSCHGDFIARHSPSLGPGIRERFDFARTISLGAYQRALDARGPARRNFLQRLGEGGVLCFPTTPDVAPKIDATEDALDLHRSRLLPLMAPASLSGCPEISLPLLKVGGVSLGVSLLAPRNRDASLINLAGQLVSMASEPLSR